MPKSKNARNWDPADDRLLRALADRDDARVPRVFMSHFNSQAQCRRTARALVARLITLRFYLREVGIDVSFLTSGLTRLAAEDAC